MYVKATKPILIQDIESDVVLDVDTKSVAEGKVYEVPQTDPFMKQVKKGVLVMVDAPKTSKSDK